MKMLLFSKSRLGLLDPYAVFDYLVKTNSKPHMKYMGPAPDYRWGTVWEIGENRYLTAIGDTDDNLVCKVTINPPDMLMHLIEVTNFAGSGRRMSL
jgi:hypothetical protein